MVRLFFAINLGRAITILKCTGTSILLQKVTKKLLTCQRIIHVKSIKLDIFQMQTAIDEYSAKKNEINVESLIQHRLQKIIKQIFVI